MKFYKHSIAIDYEENHKQFSGSNTKPSDRVKQLLPEGFSLCNVASPFIKVAKAKN